MKLFVWEDVLRDWTSGMVVALAPDLESALSAIETNPEIYEKLGAPTHTIDIDTAEGTAVFSVHGGG